MADKKIEQLTADTGANMATNDLMPFAKYVSPGVYTTVYKNGSNIINAITGLPTASFTNINTSINNVSNSILPTVNNEYRVLAVYDASQSIPSGSSVIFSIGSGSFTDLMNANQPYIITVKLYAYSNGPTIATKVQEYKIGFVNTTVLGGGANADKLFEYADAGGASITLNPSSITYHVVSDSLRFSASHSLAGEFVSIIGVAYINRSL